MSAATVGGMALPQVADTVRMRRDRLGKINEQLRAQDLDGLVLLSTNAVNYAVGGQAPAMDSGRASLFRPVAVVVTGDSSPHLFTPFPAGAPPELPVSHLHPALYPDLDGGGERFAASLAGLFPPGARLGIDHQPPGVGEATRSWTFVGAAGVLGPAKILKTPDELACIRTAQHLNELAMDDVRPLVRAGTRPVDLTARFLRRAFELGAHANGIDPIWQPMPAAKSDGPWTTHGDVAFPTPSDDRFLRAGDVVWVDTGISYEGYNSDFGRTWLVDTSPNRRQRTQSQRWHDVVSSVLALCHPGTTGLELARAATAANEGRRPWIEHFYLAHGVGTDSAEAPLIGTDLGEAFDDSLVLAPGMVLVLEPVIWDDGAAGYRSEDIVAITDDGWTMLSDYPYDPFDRT